MASTSVSPIRVNTPYLTSDQILECTKNYSKSNLIDSGAFSNVYWANLNGSAVAIKRLKYEPFQEEAVKTNFMKEIHILEQIANPHIIQVIGYCEKELCIVYPYMDGKSLKNKLTDSIGMKQFSYDQRFNVIFGIAQAITYMHSKEIIHLDIKPANILLDSHCQSKVADVGISRFLPNCETVISNNLVGTPGYIDRDLIINRSYSSKCDVFSFGLIMLHLLTGIVSIGDIHRIFEECKYDKHRCINSVIRKLDTRLQVAWPSPISEDMVKVAIECTDRERTTRPPMSEVLPKIRDIANIAFNLSRPNSALTDLAKQSRFMDGITVIVGRIQLIAIAIKELLAVARMYKPPIMLMGFPRSGAVSFVLINTIHQPSLEKYHNGKIFNGLRTSLLNLNEHKNISGNVNLSAIWLSSYVVHGVIAPSTAKVYAMYWYTNQTGLFNENIYIRELCVISEMTEQIVIFNAPHRKSPIGVFLFCKPIVYTNEIYNTKKLRGYPMLTEHRLPIMLNNKKVFHVTGTTDMDASAINLEKNCLLV